MKRLLGISLGVVFGIAGSAYAQCTPVDQPLPTTCYRTASGKCSLGTTLFADTSTCTTTAGTLGANFVGPVNVRRIGQGWATWGSPPFTEDPVPFVGYTNGASTLNINYVADASIAGFEAEPNAFGLFPIQAQFLDSGGTVVATINRTVEGSSGARLFGVECMSTVVRSIHITIDPGAQGFAIAQVRSDQFPAGASEELGLDPILPPLPEDTTNNSGD